VVEHPSPGRLEVVDAQEEPDSTGVLVADRIGLGVTIGLGEEQPRLRARRADDDPPLRTPVVRGRGRVLDELEAQRVDEEPDGVVVPLDDQCGVFEVQAANVPPSSRSIRLRWGAGGAVRCD
jgi:hypothetical protein